MHNLPLDSPLGGQQRRVAYYLDAKIREAVEDILTDPHSSAEYPVGGDLVLGPGNRENRQWARLYTPIMRRAVTA